MTKYLVMQKKNMTTLIKRHTSLLLLLLAVVFMTISGFAWNEKAVTVMADGQTQIVKTHLDSARAFYMMPGSRSGPKMLYF